MLQMCSSTPQMIPHGPLMPLQSSYNHFMMARNHHFITRATRETTRSLPEIKFWQRSVVLSHVTNLTRLSGTHPVPPKSIYQALNAEYVPENHTFQKNLAKPLVSSLRAAWSGEPEKSASHYIREALQS